MMGIKMQNANYNNANSNAGLASDRGLTKSESKGHADR